MSLENKPCPHCGAELLPIETPIESDWGGVTHWVCFNDECSYYGASWKHMARCGASHTGYRYRIDDNGNAGPVLVWSSEALRDRIKSTKKPLRASEKVALRKEGYLLPEDMGGL